MTNLKIVFKKVKVPRPQIPARAVYSTTPAQRLDYLSGISKARDKAIEYNNYITKKRAEYIKNQEDYQRKLADLRRATKNYNSSRRDVQREIKRVEAYEKQLEKIHQELQKEKERKGRASSSRSSSSRKIEIEGPRQRTTRTKSVTNTPPSIPNLEKSCPIIPAFQSSPRLRSTILNFTLSNPISKSIKIPKWKGAVIKKNPYIK